jgi:Mannosyl-glycoprotein endo-beta-N-acetylglucosaminidase
MPKKIPFVQYVVLIVVCGFALVYGWPMFVQLFQENCTTLCQNSQAQATPADSVVGTPDISASFIDSVLKNAGSPASGIGQAMDQYGAQYQIKPSFALAVFHHESIYGLKGVAPYNHSIGNIRNPNGNGYKSYATWQQSVQDFYQLIKTGYVDKGLTTISQIIPVYAPSSDGNNPTAYTQAVQSDMATWQKQR